MAQKYERVLREAFISVDMAQNILVIKTVAGMANAVCAAIDAMNMKEIVGSVAGDDTIMCAVRTVDDTLFIDEKDKKNCRVMYVYVLGEWKETICYKIYM